MWDGGVKDAARGVENVDASVKMDYGLQLDVIWQRTVSGMMKQIYFLITKERFHQSG